MREIFNDDVCMFIIIAFLLAFTVAFTIIQIGWANQSIRKLERIQEQLEEMEPPKEET